MGAVLVGGVLCFLTVLWPAYFGVRALVQSPALDQELVPDGALLRTVQWSLLIAIVSAPIGFVAGNALGRLLGGRGGRLASALCIAPLCLPGYAVFWCWWQAFGPGSALGAWAIQHDAVAMLREGILLLAMVCWSWPLIAWPIAGSVLVRSNASSTMAKLDGASLRQRVALSIRSQGGALVVGMAIIAFVMAGTTISFDLAQVATMGFELRALDAVGVSPGTLLRLALPSIVLALIGAGAALVLVRHSSHRWRTALTLRAARAESSRGAWFALVFVVVFTVALPILLALGGSRFVQSEMFWTLYAGPTMRTLVGALIDGGLGAALAGALYLQYAQGGRLLRGLALVFAGLWLVMALVPAIALSALMTAGYNSEWLGAAFYDTGIALYLGHLAGVGGVAVLIALFFAMSESPSSVAIRRLDPVRLTAVGPRLRATLTAAFAVTAVLSLGELVVTSRLEVPGSSRIATSLLNAMHYQRPDTVMIALIGLMVAGWGLALLLALLPKIALRSSMPLFLLVLMLGFVPGCADPAPESSELTRLPTDISIGAPGRGPGLFDTPRGIALDAARNRFYVVDKSARVQRFSLDGELEAVWSMPESTNGKPVGISVAPDGRVFVPDTHYNRVLVYDPDGNELMRFGSFGLGPGEFVYPTDIAFGPNGEIYVAEYGTNDRIQVFDAEGQYVGGFGALGTGAGEFTRPQSIALSQDGEELFVADACNHRIGVFGRDGVWRRALGGPGQEDGQMSYPYGLSVLPDGSILVSEFGNNRVQRLDSQTGASLGMWGGAGFERGLLRTPWGVDVAGSRVFVLDSGNARVQVATFD